MGEERALVGARSSIRKASARSSIPERALCQDQNLAARSTINVRTHGAQCEFDLDKVIAAAPANTIVRTTAAPHNACSLIASVLDAETEGGVGSETESSDGGDGSSGSNAWSCPDP